MTLKLPKLNPLHPMLLLTMVLVAITIIYLLTLAVNHSEAEDSIFYILGVSREETANPDLYYPHHVLFMTFNRLVYHFWLFLGYDGNAQLPIQINNVIASIAILFLIYLVARRLELTVFWSLLCLVAVAISYAFWWYGVEAESYHLSLLFILLSAHRLMLLAESRFEVRHFVWLGLFVAMATLFFQQHVLLIFFIPLTIFLLWYLQRNSLGKGLLFSGLTFFWGIAGTIIAAVYFFIAIVILQLDGLGEIIKWSKGMAEGDKFWIPWSWTAPLESIIGFWRTVWGGHFLFGFTWFYELVSHLFPRIVFLEEQMMGQSLSPGIRWLCLVMMIISSVCAVLLVVLAAIGFQRLFPKYNLIKPKIIGFMFFCVLMFLVNAIFITVWKPYTNEYWIALLPFFYLGMVWLIAHSGQIKFATVTSLIFLMTLFIGNLLGGILPQNNKDADYWYVTNQYFIRHAQPNDLIVSNCEQLCGRYLNLYTGATVIWKITGDNFQELIEKQVFNHHTGKIFISSTILEPPLPSFRKGKNYSAAIQTTFEQLKKSLKKVHEDQFQVVWEWQRP
ncbi:hypothetical protein THII_0510 [Thioploca ingrica]|uniref:Glycosyltransferase RgtA/B/C/D-like domain-containing protein n=1 Tax=Thioploca ingrica TaxID=40754 RepID=A0A090AHM8_9GAMM|nr:hypothetical protein THII_0510 [Thioploca ingrica]